MLFDYRYHGQSVVESSASATSMSFAPDTLREPTFFSGKLSRHIAFREAISALHDVVVSDFRFQPKDKTAYKEWAAQRELVEMAELTKGRGDLENRYNKMQKELSALHREQSEIIAPFYKAREAYFRYIYKHDYNAWYVLDPVITVHPDQVFFECFSRDESSYGRLSCGYEVFREIGDFSCGTTNVDYSSELYDQFRKIRSYKDTRFEIDPSGFEVETGVDEAYKEVKIDLPDSWVRGFLQVSAAMTLPAVKVKLHPMDVYNFCFILRRHKERKGPRSMRFYLKPGEPVRVVFEPWNITVSCPRSIFEGDRVHEIRVWGRRRLYILERLIPVVNHFTLYLTGSGMPSFYVADMGDMTFTLGLSGWTANDWSKAGNFDLMAPRRDVDEFSMQGVFDGLKENWFESGESLSRRLGVDSKMVLSALFGWVQGGRVVYDLPNDVFRVRELSREPLPMEKLRFSSEREQEAEGMVTNRQVRVETSYNDQSGNLHLGGVVRVGSREFKPELMVDGDESLRGGKCTCDFYFRNKMYKGPCSHMLALRIRFREKLPGREGLYAD